MKEARCFKGHKQPSAGPKSKSRRTLLKFLGLGSSLKLTSAIAGTNKEWADSFFQNAAILNDTIELIIYRPQDLLELKMTLTGYRKSDDNKSLIKTSSPNLLLVEFHPQSIAEQAWEETGGEGGQANFDNVAKKDLKWNNPNAPESSDMIIGDISNINPGLKNIIPPAKTYLSGTTRLVFDTSNMSTILLTPSGLLNWTGFKPIINKRASCIPVFTADEMNTPPFKNGQLLIKPEINEQTKPDIYNKSSQKVQLQRNNRQSVEGRNNIQDTVRLQPQISRDMRAATKDEALQIQQRELPKTEIKTTINKDGLNAFANLTGSNKPQPINEYETSIEFPYRLFLSPNQYAVWKQETVLKNRPDLAGSPLSTFELWHSRLMSTNCQGQADNSGATKKIKTVRALWGTDINGDWQKKPERDVTPDGTGGINSVSFNQFITSLYNDDRHCIVHQTSNFSIPKFTPKSIQVNNLMLTSLGAWLDAMVEFKRPELDNVKGSLNMLKWKHIATLARDHYVEVVYAGNMYPFGHEAALVRITERKPKNGYAANWQRYFVAITEEEKKYNPVRNNTFNPFPFSTIKILTAATPTIKSPKESAGGLSGPNDNKFVPTMLNGQTFKFKIVGYDLDGGDVSFEMPLVFVSTSYTFFDTLKPNIGAINSLGEEYQKTNLGLTAMRNQKMALSRSVNKPGETHYEVSSITFRGIFEGGGEPAGFVPKTTSIDIFVSAVENITGQRKSIKVELIDDRNKGNVFAKLVSSDSNKLNVNFNGNGNKTGGSLSPNFSVTGLSKNYGVISGKIEDAAQAVLNPKEFFSIDAKLFGIIPLSSIVKMPDTLINGESPIPALKNVETDGAYITNYTWKGAQLVEQKFFNEALTFKPYSDSRLIVETNLFRFKQNKPNALIVDSSISNFDITLADLVKVGFKKIGFKTGANAKTDFTVDMKNPALEFLGPLTFINTLQKYIPADGFSDPPFLDVTTSGITSGYSLALPDVQLGAFTLRNITLGASVSLSFAGGPLVMRFNFCEKHQPFTLTVSALGGGGFFAIEFDINGLRTLEAAMEFGAAASLNLGVASGAVSIMGGVYFKITKGDGNSKKIILEGYVRINGAMCVLGLITASIEFLLMLAPHSEIINGKEKVTKIVGAASLKIKVEVFMFSKTVTLQMSREFAGAGADPTFAMLISENEWLQYCDAFAA
jgi:hypothetical protein